MLRTVHHHHENEEKIFFPVLASRITLPPKMSADHTVRLVILLPGWGVVVLRALQQHVVSHLALEAMRLLFLGVRNAFAGSSCHA